MPATLHNVQRPVNRDVAPGALHPRSVRSEDGMMNLAKIRHARGLSQRDLGEMIGKNASTITRAEKMHRSAKMETYVACADALGVTLADLFSDNLSLAERALLETYRALPPDRQQQLAAMLDLVSAPPPPRD